MIKLDIYPDIWDRDLDETLEYLMPYVKDMRGFIRGAVGRRQGLLVSIG